MNTYLDQPVVFLLEAIFGFYVIIIMLRFLFRILRIDHYNPVSQAIIRLTQAPLKLLYRFIPSIGRVDIAAIVLMIGVQYSLVLLITLIVGGPLLPVALLMVSLLSLVNHAFNIFIFAIVIQAVLSWIAPVDYGHPLTGILYRLTSPLLVPARRMIPAAGGLDFSPMVVIIALVFFKLLLIPPLQDLIARIGL